MDIIFKTKKFMKQCNSKNLLVRAYGPRCAELIRRRLDEIRAADTLETLRSLPQARCHELKGNRAGQLSVDLVHPYRLVFEPLMDQSNQKSKGGLDWSSITAVEIIGVEDTHG